MQGLAAASTEKNGKWGYIDSSGTFVVEAKFDAVADFAEGFAVAGQVVPGKDVTKPGGITYGLIDKTGAWAVQPTYARIGNVSEGMARVQIINADGSVSGGFIDTTGKLVLSSTEWMPASDFSEGLAVVAVGKKYGFIDTDRRLRAAAHLRPRRTLQGRPGAGDRGRVQLRRRSATSTRPARSSSGATRPRARSGPARPPARPRRSRRLGFAGQRYAWCRGK